MAARATSLLFFFGAILCHLHAGEAAMEVLLKSQLVAVAVTKTGGIVGGQPEYRADFTTASPCPVVGVRFTCDGLEGSAEPLDTSTVEVVGDAVCKIKVPVVRETTVSFKFALEAPVNFRVIGGDTACTN